MCVCFHYLALCGQHSAGQDGRAVSVIPVTSAVSVWSLSPSCQPHSELLASKAELVSNGNFLCVPFPNRGIGIVFVRQQDAGKTTTKHSTPAPSPVGRCPVRGRSDDAKIDIVTLITLLALCGFRDFRAFQPISQIGISDPSR